MKKLFVLALMLGYIFFTGCGQGHHHDNAGNDHEQTNNTNHNHGNTDHNHPEDNSNHQHEHEHETIEKHDHEHAEEEHSQSRDEHEHDSGEHTHSHDEQEHATEEHSHSSGEDAHNHSYQVEMVQATSFHEVVRTSGEILSLPKNETELIAPVSGVVRFADNNILSGKSVGSQEGLFYISGEAVAENNLFVKFQKAEALFEQKSPDFKRAEKLYEEELISEKEYLQHKTEYLNAKAEYETLKNHFTGRKGMIKSPVQGYLKEVYVREGDYVQMGQKVASVLQKDRLLLKAEVSQKYAPRLDEFVDANFRTADGELYSTESLNGKVLSRGKALTRESFYLPLHFEIDQDPSLVPGSFVHVFLIGKKRDHVIALPEEAFIEEQGNFFVFVEENEELIKRKVQTGPSDGKLTLVKSGIKEGDKVVTQGAYQVKLMKTSSNLPAHGHSH